MRSDMTTTTTNGESDTPEDESCPSREELVLRVVQAVYDEVATETPGDGRITVVHGPTAELAAEIDMNVWAIHEEPWMGCITIALARVEYPREDPGPPKVLFLTEEILLPLREAIDRALAARATREREVAEDAA